jgi:hydroxypyruvate isomerase
VQVGNAPNTGHILETLQDAGYNGWIAADYVSQGPTEDTLGWMPKVAA